MGDLTDDFSRSEFKCKCGCGTDNISIVLVKQLQRLRTLYGKPITINSGCRCPAHNAAVGGVADSAHLCMSGKEGLAADIHIDGGRMAYELLDIIYTYNLFARIGIGKTLLHLDIDRTKDQNVLWPYGNK